MAEPVAFKYRAFISYSHADTAWAKWLHRGLASFRIDKDLAGRETATGTIPNALRPIFRDRDDFAAGHSLTDQTLAALGFRGADRDLIAGGGEQRLCQRGDQAVQGAASGAAGDPVERGRQARRSGRRMFPAGVDPRGRY